jgi:hypothetical protein
MNKFTLRERREIAFTAAMVLDAALVFDREHNGGIWRGSGHALQFDPAGDGAIVLLAVKAGMTEATRTAFGAAWVAAALLHYCFKRRIPMPRHATKRIERAGDGIKLVIETSTSMLPVELAGAALAAAPAATTPVSA